MIRILIVAPYASLRAGLHALLADEPDCAIVGAASGSEELETLLQDVGANVVLWEVGEEESEFARILGLVISADSGLLALSEQREDLKRLLASDVSAWAMLRREADGSEIASAVRAVSAGLVVIDRSLVRQLGQATAPPTLDGSSLSGLPGETLTPREREVLQLMTQGLANKQIAFRLSISLHTVKFHVASILAKLNATSRTEAVTVGARRGLVTL